MVKRILINEMVNGREFLSGLVGRSLYPKLVESIDKQRKPQPVFLDFTGLTVSGSFFGQAIMPLRLFARRMDAYVVLCNLNDESLEELRWMLEDKSDAVLICELDDNDNVSSSTWIGNLDAKQRLTFEAVLRLGCADAARLADEFPAEDIVLTGWNNRLSALNKRGLLMEIRNGRSKSYCVVLDNLIGEV